MSDVLNKNCSELGGDNLVRYGVEAKAQLLNRDCYCKTLNTEALHQWIREQALPGNLVETLPQFFSNTAVFITERQYQQIKSVIDVISRLVQQKSYQQLITPDQQISPQDMTGGVFMGFDFHLHENGPQLIEINTNAGGGFLNAVSLGAQTACCNMGAVISLLQDAVEQEFVAMFRREWQLARNTLQPVTLAIVDEAPSEQFLYPEFLLAQRLLERAGVTTLIIDSAELVYETNQLKYRGQIIDMVYNRLTDFALQDSKQQHLRRAYNDKTVVLSPNQLHHTLFADKRNLVVMSDPVQLFKLGLSDPDIQVLKMGVPSTKVLSCSNADQLWTDRKHLFFKPATGFGSRAAYRGDKITKRVWEEIVQGNYVAQQQITPSERGIIVDGKHTALKLDIRAYVYQGKIQLLAARLYQGQTTNFRTQGGGFAPVFVI